MAIKQYTVSPAPARTLLFQALLPDNAIITASLRIIPEIPIGAIPQGTSVHGFFDVSGNTALTRVKNNVTIDGAATFHSCTSLMTVGSNFKAAGHCDFSRCHSLVLLGENLVAEKNLILAGCSQSLILPKEGYVGGDVILPVGYDPSLIPPSFVVKGSIYSDTPTPRDVVNDIELTFTE
jgi:hypothetical protein